MTTHISSGAGDEVGLGTSSLAGGCCTGSHNAPASGGSEAGPDSMWTSGLAGASRASISISSLVGASTSISGCADLSHTSSSTYGWAGAWARRLLRGPPLGSRNGCRPLPGSSRSHPWSGYGRGGWLHPAWPHPGGQDGCQNSLDLLHSLAIGECRWGWQRCWPEPDQSCQIFNPLPPTFDPVREFFLLAA